MKDRVLSERKSKGQEGLILRLACDLPTVGRAVLETYDLFGSACLECESGKPLTDAESKRIEQLTKLYQMGVYAVLLYSLPSIILRRPYAVKVGVGYQ